MRLTSCVQSFSVRTKATTFISQTYLPTPSPGPFLNNPNFPQKKHCHKLVIFMDFSSSHTPVNGNIGRWLLLANIKILGNLSLCEQAFGSSKHGTQGRG